jgi:hypothetical protein
MKAQLLVAFALSALGCGISAHAHDVDPGGRIEVACVGDTVRMAAITHAVENSHYWAPQAARRQMLSLARQACASGAELVTFVPPADQRPCRAPPKWSTLCFDGAAAARRARDAFILSSSSARE